MNPVEFRAVRVACGLSAMEAAEEIGMGLCNPGTKHSSVLGRISDARRSAVSSAYGYEWR